MLELRGVSRFFGGVHALEAVSMQVHAGAVHGLIGPNGAGKTTLLNLLTGVDRPTVRQIVLDGRRLDGRPAHHVARLGVPRTFQNIRLFGALSALDNVLVARHPGELSRSLGRLAHGRPAGTLSYADQRRVELARALATEPRLLLLDEPTAGMNRTETDQLGTTCGTSSCRRGPSC